MHSTDKAYRLAELYAQPLFDLAVEQRQIEAVETDLDLLATLLDTEPRLGRFLASPAFVLEEKFGLLQKVLSGSVQALTLRFLEVLLRHHRAFFLGDIMTRFGEFYNAYVGRIVVEMTVARSLSQAEHYQMSADLTRALGSQVQLNITVDPSILGGTVIRYQGKRVDNSVQGRLQRAFGRIARAGKGTNKTNEI